MAQVLKDEVKEKIKNSAVQVFCENGFNRASIKSIADSANVSVGNVYRYYENKEDLYEAVVADVYEGIREIMAEVDDASVSDGAISLTIPIKRFIGVYTEHQQVFEMLLKGEKDRHYDKTISMMTELLTEYFQNSWTEGFENRYQNVYGRTMKRFDPVEVSAFTHAMVYATIEIVGRTDDDELERELTAFLTRMVKGYFHMRQMEVVEG